MGALLENISQIIQTNPVLALALAFVAGVGVSFTPCVYPVIPITLGVIGAKSAGSRWRGFTLSLVYVLGIAVVYAALGAIASLSGQLFGQISVNPVTYFFVANVCLLLGLSMLEVFQIPQFSFSQNAAASKKKGYLGVFIVGLFSGLVIGPCTAPVLAALLVYVGTKQNILYGFGLLFAFGYGVGFLMILLGTFSGLLTSLPKSGEWLIKIKKGFGWLLIAVAEYYLIKMGGLL